MFLQEVNCCGSSACFDQIIECYFRSYLANWVTLLGVIPPPGPVSGRQVIDGHCLQNQRWHSNTFPWTLGYIIYFLLYVWTVGKLALSAINSNEQHFFLLNLAMIMYHIGWSIGSLHSYSFKVSLANSLHGFIYLLTDWFGVERSSFMVTTHVPVNLVVNYTLLWIWSFYWGAWSKLFSQCV